jgi:putative transcriptional regulator
MIKWNLAVVMAERRIKNKKLAILTGFHETTISRHKSLITMPQRLEEETLDGYCRALNCQPGDLMKFEYSEEIDSSSD